jgi:4-amino-4-deoxy-L-arabinose transferase-like glycosyltransferase
MDDTSRRDKPRWTNLLAVAVFALLVRSVVVIVLFDSLQADPDAYRRIAENLRQNGVFGSTDSPTAFRPPLYPLLLAATAVDGNVSPVAVGIIHILLGVATVAITYLLAEEWRLGRWSWVAAGLVALDPILLNQSALVMTETLATFLAAAGLLALTRTGKNATPSRVAVAAAILALASLCRPTFLPWLALSGVALLLVGVDARKRIRHGVIYVATAAVVLSPWVIRNYAALGAWKVTTTHGGYTILLGNNPSFYRYLRNGGSGQPWDSKQLAEAWERRGLSESPQDGMWELPLDADKVPARDPISRTELEDDRFAYSLARRYITDEPKMFAYSCGIRVARLWQLMPYKRSRTERTVVILLRVMIGAWYTFLFVLAAAGLVVRRGEIVKSPIVWGLLLAFAFTAVHSVYWSNMRMRAPLMPSVSLLATIGAAWFVGRMSRHKH